jgi:GNAT superfamily N-acetyltransferase
MIRPYCSDDMPRIVEIADRAWRPINAAYEEMLGTMMFETLFPDPDTRIGINVQKAIEERPDTSIVYEVDGKVIAFCTWWLELETGMGVIGYNGKDPLSTERGVGQKMYAYVLDEFRKAGMKLAKVHTGLDPGHAPARRAYEKAGFDRAMPSVNYYMEL